MPNWTAVFSREAGKQFEKLRRSGSRPPIADAIGLLMMDFKKVAHISTIGLTMRLWRQDISIAIFVRANPLMLLGWRIVHKQTQYIEVYYVGTHEGAPY